MPLIDALLDVSGKTFGRNRMLKTGQTTVYVAGDDGTYQAGDAKRYSVLTAGQYAGTTNITLNGKTDSHSNNVVRDLNTGLMWSRYALASVGPNSNGTLPWTTNANGEGIFAYCAAANAAGLGVCGQMRDGQLHRQSVQRRGAAHSWLRLDGVGQTGSRPHDAG